ncbi:MAG: IS1634 family transposase [Bacilli bacterium]
MFKVVFDNKDKTDKIIYIKHSYSVKGVKKQLIIEKYPSAKELDAKYGSWESFIDERIKILTEEKKSKENDKKEIVFDYCSPISLEGCQNTFNFGYLLMQMVYYHLGLDQFFYHLKNNNNLRIKYSLNDVMKFLIYTRAIIPGSKLDNSKRINYFAESFDITIDDIYDALDRFDDCKDKLQEYLYKKASYLLPPTNKVIFYDVTNFYYEIENENDLCAYGVEKNHRPDPITSFGLFMDCNGIPIKYSAYRGNINENKQLLPEWKKLESSLEGDGYILCSDAGLNSANIKHYLITRRNHYIFSQSVKKLGDTTKKEIFEEKGWLSLSSDKKYKIKKFLKDSYIDDPFSKNKSGKTKVEIDTMYIFIFDEKRRRFMLNKIEEREKKARDIISNPSKYDKVSSSDGKQYIQKVCYDDNGEIIIEKSTLNLNTELIEKEKKYAGYGAIVTDLFNESVFDIINIAFKRWEIEDCFRQMKTGFSTRPVYLRTTKHIHAHFLTCYIALTITKLLEKKYLRGISSNTLFDILRNTSYIKFPTGDWMVGNISKEAIQAFKKVGFNDLLFTYFSNKSFIKIISSSKQKYQ